MSNGFLLSPYQKHFFSQGALSSAAQLAIRLEGSPDTELLQKALINIIERHEILRTRFDTLPGMILPVQAVYESELVWQQKIYDGEFSGAVLNEVLQQLRDDAKERSHDNLISAILFEQQGNISTLVLTMHPLFADNMGLKRLNDELCMEYSELVSSGKGCDIEEPLQYIDVSAWVTELIESEDAIEGINYWKHRCAAGDIKVKLSGQISLSTTFDTSSIKTMTTELSAIEVTQLSAFANLHKVNVDDVLFSLWLVLISRLSGNTKPVIGMAFDGRNDEQLMETLGVINRYLPIDGNFEEDVSFIELVKQNARKKINGADWLECFSWPQHWSRLQPEGEFFNYSFAAQSGFSRQSVASIDFSVAACFVELDCFALKLDCLFDGDNDAIHLAFKFNSDTLSAETVAAVQQQYQQLMSSALETPNSEINDLQLLPEKQRSRILNDFNPQTIEYETKHQAIHQMFEAHVAGNQDKNALEFKGKAISYKDLNCWSNALAHQLTEKGCGTEIFVAVFAQRSFGLIAAMLAISKAGGVYVPLDPSYPQDRIDYMLKDSASKIVLCLPELLPTINDDSVQVIPMVQPDNNASEVTNLDCQVDTSSTAYLIYTSGSTGLPKGTLIPQSSLINHIKGISLRYNSTPDDRVLLFAPANFDPSIEQIYVPLCNGATVVIRDEDVWSPLEIADKIDELKLTVINFPTAYWNLVVKEWTENSPLGKVDQLRLTISGGDRMLKELVDDWHQIGLEHVSLINAYGPTEAVVTATMHYVQTPLPVSVQDIPIGKSMVNRQSYILDSKLQPVPVGCVGELCLGGDSLASGYHNRDEDTKAKFLPDPFNDGINARIYRTGDMAYFDENGDIHFIGRSDSQLKIRGYRVELGEVEQVLNHHGDVVEAVVIVKDSESENKSLVGFYTVSADQDVVEQLQQQLTDKLPEYMHPSELIKIDEFPLTPSGKVDRKYLSHNIEHYNTVEKNTYVAPEGEIETRLAELWFNLFAVDKIGRHDNFFGLGGHSLIAMKMISHIKETFEVAMSIREIYDSEDLANLATMIEDRQQQSNNLLPQLAAQSREQQIPLSYGQERIWFLAALGESDKYHMPGLVRIEGPLNEQALQQSLNFVIKRHESLRTQFVKNGDGAEQIVSDVDHIYIEKVDVSAGCNIANVDTFRPVVENWIHRPFNLASAPLMRVILLKFGEDSHVLGVCMHHIISDGWSINILLQDISGSYVLYREGKDAMMTLPAIQYPDYAIWQRRYMDDKYLDKEVQFWRNQLGGFDNLEMPTDMPRPKRLSGRGERVLFPINPEQINRLKKICEQNKVTVFTIFIASVHTLLQHYADQSNFCLGIPVANRDNHLIEQTVGFFVNTVVLKLADQSATASKSELFDMVHNTMISAQDHQNLPFEKLVEAVNPERDQSRNPLFQVLVNYIDLDTNLELAGCKAHILDPLYSISKFDLSFDFVNTPDGGVDIHIEYSSDLYRRESIDFMGEQLLNIVELFSGEFNESVQTINFTTETEQAMIAQIQQGNIQQDLAQVDLAVTLDQLFSAQAQRTPDQVAVSCEQEQLTYVELEQRSHQLAAYLREGGLQNGQFVGIYIDRSVSMLVGLLGIMKAGGAYIPLDPQYPVCRIQYIIQDSAMPMLVTSSSLTSNLDGQLNSDVKIVYIEQTAKFVDASVCHSRADGLAYAIYTSGSTGQPKGVKVSHANVVNFMQSMTDNPGFASGDTLLAVTTYSFDIAALELFLPLINGGTCVIASATQLADMQVLKETIESVKPAVMQMTPSAWSALFRMDWHNEQGIRILCGGEALSLNLKEQFKRTGSDVWNMYGPTETTIWSTVKKLDYTASLSIGTPIANTQVAILNSTGQPCPIGVPGLIHIGGAGVTQGYINKPELTAESFVQTDNGLVFNTGDMGRWISNRGHIEIECLGRVDSQVKLRGFRIELGEIETALLSIDGIEAAAAVISSTGDEAQLVAYYEAEAEQDIDQLMLALRQKLPVYMVPGVVSLIDKLLYTPNGKLDRKALALLTLGGSSTVQFVAPETETECELQQLWLLVLNVGTIGKNDNFFELGGHSLNLVSLHSRIKTHFKVHFQLQLLFEYATLADMAVLINTQQFHGDEQISIPKAANTDNAALSFAQQRLWLADQMNPGTSVYNNVSTVKLTGDINTDYLNKALNEIENRHESLRTSFQYINGKAVQIVNRHFERQYEVHDLTGLDQQSQQTRLKALVVEQEQHSFKLTTGPIWQAEFAIIADDAVIMILNYHHICVDGWSMRIIIEEMSTLYDCYTNGTESPLKTPQIQYIDYAIWQNQQTAVFEEHLSFWQSELADAPDTSDYLIDHPREEAIGGKGASIDVTISADLTTQLRKLGQLSGVTLFMTLQSAFNIALHMSTGKHDLVIGTDVANRDHQEIENLIGFFVNQLVLRTSIDLGISVNDMLATTRKRTIAAFSHQEIPFDQLVSQLNVPRRNDSTPLFQTKFFLESIPDETYSLNNMKMEFTGLETAASRLDLTLGLVEYENVVKGNFVYNSALFKAKTIELLSQRFDAVLTLMLLDPNMTLAQLTERVGADEQRRREAEQGKLMQKQLGSFKRGSQRRTQSKEQPVVKTVLPAVTSGPVQFGPSGDTVELDKWLASNKAHWEPLLTTHGACLFRGFSIDSVDAFERLTEHTFNEIYQENTEHQGVTDNGIVQTPVKYSKDQQLLWHNENTFNQSWPSRIMFNCQVAASEGGETPIVDSRLMFQTLDKDIVEKFTELGVMYVRNYAEDDVFGLGWKTIFGTDDKQKVEQACADSDLTFEWKDNNRLTTYAKRPAVMKDPNSDQWCWITQSQHWHFSCLDSETKKSIKQLHVEADYPRNCYFGNGEKIADEMMSRILACYEQLESSFVWQVGDVLLVDNLLMAHGRNAYKGDRKLLVSIGDIVNFDK
ncbi:MAG: amino acid adenylation domain-containing protein [Alteromonadaceae bacterium]|nr:amino acid adenylation domain-containing protein [Alteromonadaceae bacterium]